MDTAITCGDRHATADLDTYEHATMVQVRCECKANFYAWSMQSGPKDGASVPLAVPVAGLSDNETIHKIKCEVCPEVRTVPSPPGVRALDCHPSAPAAVGTSTVRHTVRATGGRRPPTGHRLSHP